MSGSPHYASFQDPSYGIANIPDALYNDFDRMPATDSADHQYTPCSAREPRAGGPLPFGLSPMGSGRRGRESCFASIGQRDQSRELRSPGGLAPLRPLTPAARLVSLLGPIAPFVPCHRVRAR